MPILDAEDTQHPKNLLLDFNEQPEDRRWWAVYTKARQEKALAQQLVQMDVPFYLPLIPKEVGRHVKSHIPLFTGYIFVCGSEDERIKLNRPTGSRPSCPWKIRFNCCRICEQIATLIDANAPLTVEKRLMAARSGSRTAP